MRDVDKGTESSALVKLLLADVGLLAVGLYCAGRWYKEAYFWEFDIPWDLVEFAHADLLFAGWFSVLWAASLTALLLHVHLHGWPIRSAYLHAIWWGVGRGCVIAGSLAVLLGVAWSVLWFLAPDWWTSGVRHLSVGRLGWMDWLSLLFALFLSCVLAISRVLGRVSPGTSLGPSASPTNDANRASAPATSGQAGNAAGSASKGHSTSRDVLVELLFLNRPAGQLSVPAMLSIAVVALLGVFVVSSALGRYHVQRALQYGFGHPAVRLKDSPATDQPVLLITRMGKDRNFLRMSEGVFVVAADDRIARYCIEPEDCE